MGEEPQASLLHCRHIILATGAQERPFPIPGWTLPGVITAGAGQILLKTSGVVPEGRTVLAGGGPLLYLLAYQYLNAGVKLDAILETTASSQWLQALPHAWNFLRSPYLGKGLTLMRAVRKAVPIVSGVTALEALAGENGQLAEVRYTAGGQSRSMAVDQLLLHQGVVPNTNLSRAVGAEHAWNDLQDCWEPVVDAWGATSVPQLSIAGDGAGIAGAMAAEHRGRIAAVHVAAAVGRIDTAARDREAAPHQAALARATRGREFLEVLYRPAAQFRRPVGDTIVCRCEEATAEQVRHAARIGCQGPNQMKAFLRCGMGPCQGRFCGLTVTELIADEQQRHPRDVGYYRLRFPTKPVTLGGNRHAAADPGIARGGRAFQEVRGEGQLSGTDGQLTNVLRQPSRRRTRRRTAMRYGATQLESEHRRRQASGHIEAPPAPKVPQRSSAAATS
ncbi:hypothetical protein OJJOAM_003186 [Cupriavidus sp. H18C1]|uniref:FAD-dependent oxidoreductase n=1 Tax=Cupriavidus sp. H18C1 TaxID=3241601 RepID=UPI003BB8AEA8